MNITPQSLTPRSQEVYYYPIESGKVVKNKRSVTLEESKAFVIDFNLIEEDGRTTVMVKNIPNKYTQDMLLDEFCVNHDNHFDFFYLPIDKDVLLLSIQNNCNVGYAFVNFINTSFLK